MKLIKEYCQIYVPQLKEYHKVCIERINRKWQGHIIDDDPDVYKRASSKKKLIEKLRNRILDLERMNEKWDRQLEQDAKDGTLDRIFKESLGQKV